MPELFRVVSALTTMFFQNIFISPMHQ